jgi:hypothetical protein
MLSQQTGTVWSEEKTNQSWTARRKQVPAFGIFWYYFNGWVMIGKSAVNHGF